MAVRPFAGTVPRPPQQQQRPTPAAAARAAGWCCLLAAFWTAGPAAAQDAPAASPPPSPPPAPAAPPLDDPYAVYESRLIREVRFEGLNNVPEQFVRNQVRTRAGQPLSAETIRADIQRLDRLGRFRNIDASLTPLADQSVVITYRFVETPIIRAAEVVGNRQVSNDELRDAVVLLPNPPIDQFQIDRARRAIENVYRRKGFYLAEVTIDESELEETGTLIFHVRERDRIKVTDIRFEGNNAFSDAQVRTAVRTKVAGLFETGPLDDEVLDQDVASIIAFYRERGYLDVRVDRRITESPNLREAIVTFLIDEGPQYTLRSVRAELADETGRGSGRPTTVLSTEQITGLMRIKPGDAYAVRRVDESIRAIRDAYGKLGYVDARVTRLELRDPSSPQVDLVVVIHEGERVLTGLIKITGNDLTRQNVIRRQVRIRPDRPLDTTAVADSRRRLEQTDLFARDSVRVTIQPPDPAIPGYRDVLVEVEESNTGSLTLGVGVTSDTGLLGALQLRQRNFDLADVPNSLEELFTGRAFRGGGQVFNLVLAPGTEVQNYSISLSDPYFLDSDFSISGSLLYRTQRFRQYDEKRYGGQFALGRRFGDRWNLEGFGRVYNVDLTDIDADAPTEVFRFDDEATVTGLGLRLSRTTFDHIFRPTRGTRIELSVEQVGLLGGDFDYTRLSAEHTLILPIYQDFLDRTTTLAFRTTVSYIPQDVEDVPVYERFYLGGRTLRGFRYRTVSPKGIANDTGLPSSDPVGGSWAFSFSTELTQPLWRDVLAGAVFVDTGTVLDDPGFDDFRVAAGLGLRISIPQLGPAPIALDFAVPILKEDRDKSRLFSFSLDIPF